MRHSGRVMLKPVAMVSLFPAQELISARGGGGLMSPRSPVSERSRAGTVTDRATFQ